MFSTSFIKNFFRGHNPEIFKIAAARNHYTISFQKSNNSFRNDMGQLLNIMFWPKAKKKKFDFIKTKYKNEIHIHNTLRTVVIEICDVFYLKCLRGIDTIYPYLEQKLQIVCSVVFENKKVVVVEGITSLFDLYSIICCKMDKLMGYLWVFR